MRMHLCLTVLFCAVLGGNISPVYAEPKKEDKSLTEWRRVLTTAKDKKDRVDAARIIAEFRAEARVSMDDLLAAIKDDKSWEVRQQAIESAMNIGRDLEFKGPEVKKAIAVLHEGLKDDKAPDYEGAVRWSFLVGLGNMSPKDPNTAKKLVELILPYFKDKNKTVRGGAVYALGAYLENSKLTEQIKAVSTEMVKLLRDPEDYVRDAVKTALPMIDPATAKKNGIE